MQKIDTKEYKNYSSQFKGFKELWDLMALTTFDEVSVLVSIGFYNHRKKELAEQIIPPKVEEKAE